MKQKVRINTRLRQKAILRILTVSTGIALMAGIGFFVVSNFSSSVPSLASGNVLLPGKKTEEQSFSINRVSPNPFNDDFLIDIRSEKEQSLGIYLYDVTGKRVAEHTTEQHAGNMFVNINPGADLAPGMYVLMVIGEDMIPQHIRLQKM